MKNDSVDSTERFGEVPQAPLPTPSVMQQWFEEWAIEDGRSIERFAGPVDTDEWRERDYRCLPTEDAWRTWQCAFYRLARECKPGRD